MSGLTQATNLGVLICVISPHSNGAVQIGVGLELAELHANILGGFLYVITIGPGIFSSVFLLSPGNSWEIQQHNQNAEPTMATYKVCLQNFGM